ncbi:hypothetical protein PspLS_10257 [Pyricularia sp. CBS 133598]|nr:hypothetical protein PspLS_10257 [Pyricularia sp. CBS 133598]
MAAQTTITVPHLGGVTAGYRLSEQPSADKPVLVLINSMCTTSSLFDAQFASRALTDAVTLLAVEPLAHGATRCDARGHYTYWDSAVVALQVMEALGVHEAFALGTSQGGWIVVRMAMLAPERILGLLPLGTSMDSESSYSRSKGCWDPRTTLAPFLEAWSTTENTPDFVVDDAWCTAVGSLGFSGAVAPETLQFWTDTLRSVYRGDRGRRMLKMALVNLVERDGLLWRLRDVVCPVYWLQGTRDVVFGVDLCREHVGMFVNAVERDLVFVEGGGHYLNATSPAEVEAAVLRMVGKIPNIPPLATNSGRTRWRNTILDPRTGIRRSRLVLVRPRTPIVLHSYNHAIAHSRRQAPLPGRYDPGVPVGDRVARREACGQGGEDAVARVLVRHDAVPGGKVGLEKLRRQVRVAGQGWVEGEGRVGGLEVLWEREGRHGLGFSWGGILEGVWLVILVATHRQLGVSNPDLYFSRTMIGCAIQKPAPLHHKPCYFD